MADYPTSPPPVSIKVSSVAAPYVSVANNLRSQARDRGAHAWRLQFNYTPRDRATFAPLWAFLVGRGGRADTFTVDIPNHASRGTGFAAVSGAGQTGTSVNYGSATASSLIFAAGDLITFQNDAKLYMVQADSNSDALGDGTVTIYPALRQSPPDAGNIVGTVATATVRLEQNEFAVDVDQCLKYRWLSVAMIEAI